MTIPNRAAPPANAAPSGAQVGFWAGETRQNCLNIDPINFCPRNLGIYTPQLWSTLQTTQARLFINLVYGADFGPVIPGQAPLTDGLGLVREANSLGIPVDAWITMPLALGRYVNQQNASDVEQAVQVFASWTASNNLTIGQIVLDLEFPLGYQALYELQRNNVNGALAIAKSTLNPSEQCQAMATYRDTISWAHEHGIAIGGTPEAFVLDDIESGHMALQNALNIAAIPPFGYDDIYLQAYRGVFPLLGSGYVASYFTEMQQNFGATGQVSLGDSGKSPYNVLSALVQDVRMLAGMGATSIPIFDLDGAVNAFGVSGVEQIVDAGHQPLTGPDLIAAEQPNAFDTLTRDVFHAAAVVATDATPVVSAFYLDPLPANAYPNGCGDLHAVPLAAATG